MNFYYFLFVAFMFCSSIFLSCILFPVLHQSFLVNSGITVLEGMKCILYIFIFMYPCQAGSAENWPLLADKQITQSRAFMLSLCFSRKVSHHGLNISAVSSIHPPTHPSVHSSIHPSIHPSTHPPTHPPIHLPTHPFTHLHIHPPIHSPIHPFFHPPIYPSSVVLYNLTVSSFT
mgnify:CR=1 FL=1